MLGLTQNADIQLVYAKLTDRVGSVKNFKNVTGLLAESSNAGKEVGVYFIEVNYICHFSFLEKSIILCGKITQAFPGDLASIDPESLLLTYVKVAIHEVLLFLATFIEKRVVSGSGKYLVLVFLLKDCRIDLGNIDDLSRGVVIRTVNENLFVHLLLLLTAPSEHNDII